MKLRLLTIAASALMLVGCPYDDDDSNYDRTYTISVTNLTANQPLSPLAVLGHNSHYQLFTLGSAATQALEMLAEGGDNSAVLAIRNSSRNVGYSASGSGVILPGSSDTVTLTMNRFTASRVSVASMLVNTNDAFVGETKVRVSQLGVGESVTMNMTVWDSGTEANAETAATVPGPAGGGEGFNSTRDDSDKVSFHAGVVSQDDGLATSVLKANHRFLNPGAKLTITRTQ